MSSDGLINETLIPPPLEGLYDGLDPALPDEIYSPLRAPDLLNLRVINGLWQTRPGQTLFATIPGSGDVRYFAHFYTAAGGRFRLAARGSTTAGVFYDYEVGTDTSFQTTSGGTGMGGSTALLFQGEMLNDRLYLTDRQSALWRYEPSPSSGNQLRAIVAVTAPTAAARVKPRSFATFDDFSTIGSTWSQSDTAKYELTDTTSTVPAPMGLRTGQLQNKSSSAKGNTASENVTSEILQSHTIAFWVNQNTANTNGAFEIGVNAAGEFSFPMKAAADDEWFVQFCPVGDLPTISYKQFKSLRSPGGTQTMWVSSLVLPGRLEGQYRWVYTHYDSTTGRESAPSAISGSGTPTDFSAIGITNQNGTSRAFQKCAALDFTSDSGTDSTTDKIRIYRNGGVPSLTKDSRGRDVWYRVGTVNDFSTTLNGAHSAGATSITVVSGTTIAAGDLLVIDKGVAGKEEYVSVFSGGGVSINLGKVGLGSETLMYSHSTGAAVQIAFLDNVANEALDTTGVIDLERDAPPAAIQWIARSPEGRLWAFNYSGKPTGVRVSNRSTPERPTDYEVMPLGVDPLTRRSILQGWDFEIGGDTTDEAITWGGFFRSQPYAFTKRHLYVVQAQSQIEWGPNAIQPVLNLGCLAGETVSEVNGVLYWVAPGPHVVRWAGPGTAPEILTDQRCAGLATAPTGYWSQWVARPHRRKEGHYYVLYYTPSGATTNTARLDYNTDRNLWEPMRFVNSQGTTLAFATAAPAEGGSDLQELFHAATGGGIYQTETGLTDHGAAIPIRAVTKKFRLEGIALLQQLYLRLAAVTDSVTVTVAVGGSEYGDLSQSYTVSFAGSGDKEVKVRLHRTLMGRWVQITVAGNVSNRPALREMVVRSLPVRQARLS